jgi:hypothetical protein
MRSGMASWTEKRVERLKLLHKEGFRIEAEHLRHRSWHAIITR